MAKKLIEKNEKGHLVVNNKLFEAMANQSIANTQDVVKSNVIAYKPTRGNAAFDALDVNKEGKKWFYSNGLDDLQKKVAYMEYQDAKQKSQDQGFFGELKGFVAQSVVGEVILGTVDGIGHLLDLPKWVDVLSGNAENADWNNWLSDLAEQGKEKVREAAPIYEDPDNKNRNFGENLLYGDGWWASNGVSMASTLSLMIPAAGYARALGYGAKLAKGARVARALSKPAGLAGKTTQALDNVASAFPRINKFLNNNKSAIHQAFASRMIESSMEATQVFKDRYDYYKNDLGLSEEEAKKQAGKGAAFTFKNDMALGIIDLAQYMLIGKSFKSTKLNFDSKIAKLTNFEKVAKPVVLGSKFLATPITEGFEEFYQYIQQEEGKEFADSSLLLNLQSDKDKNKDAIKKLGTLKDKQLGDYLHDSEAWTSAFWGAMGGKVFDAAGNLMKRIAEKNNDDPEYSENKRRYLDSVDHVVRAQRNLSALVKAVESKDEVAIEAARKAAAFDLAYKAAMQGNWGILKRRLESLKNVDTAKEQDMGAITQDILDLDPQQLDSVIALGENVAKLFEKNAARYNMSTVESITRREFLRDQNKANAEMYFQQAEQAKESIFNTLNINSNSGKANVQVEVTANNIAIDFLKKLQEYISKQTKQVNPELNEIIQKRIKDLDIENKSLQQSLDLEDTSEVIGNITEGELFQNYANSKSQAIASELMQNVNQAELNKMTSPEYQRKVEESLINYFKNKNKEKKAKKNKEKEEEKVNNITKTPNSVSENTIDNITDGETLYNAVVNDEVALEDLNEEQLEAFKEYKQNLENIFDELEETAVEDTEDDYADFISNDDTEQFVNAEEAGLNDELESVDVEKTIDSLEVTEDNTDQNFEDEINKTSIITALAWRSSNNKPGSFENQMSAENKALTAYLENKDNSVVGAAIEFEIDFAYMEAEAANGSKLYKDILKALTDKNITSKDLTFEGYPLLGFLPVKAVLKANGEQIVYDGYPLSMRVHDVDFFFDYLSKKAITSESENQKNEVLRTKSLVVDAYYNNTTVSSKIIGKTNGTYFSKKTEAGKFARNNISEVTGINAEELEFVFGIDLAGQGKFYNADGSINLKLRSLSKASKGSIYTIVQSANGTSMPVKLQLSKLSQEEAIVIYNIYKILVNNPSAGKDLVPKEIENLLLSAKSDKILQLTSYLDLQKIKLNELLSELVYDGTKTKGKGESTLLIEKGFVKFGGQSISKKDFNSNESKEKFIDYLVKSKLRQINVKRLNNKTYKSYIVANNLVNTNLEKTEGGANFIQPVIIYDPNFTEKTSTKESEKIILKNLGVTEDVMKLLTDKDKNNLLKATQAEAVIILEKYKLQNSQVQETLQESKEEVIPTSTLTEAQKANLEASKKGQKVPPANKKFDDVVSLVNYSKSLIGKTFNVNGLTISFEDFKGEVLTGAGQRVFVKVLINGVPVTFYSSTGSGKKALQEGVFYPTLGIESDERFNGTWINKIDGVTMASYYNSASLASVGAFLDAQFGNTNSYAGIINDRTIEVQNPEKTPLTKELALEIRREYNKEFLNSGRDTFSNTDVREVTQAFEDLVREVESTVTQTDKTSEINERIVDEEKLGEQIDSLTEQEIDEVINEIEQEDEGNQTEIEAIKAEIEKLEKDKQEKLDNRGQNLLTQGFNDLLEATKSVQVANAIFIIETNKYHGAILSKEQEQQLSEAKAKLKGQGYEVRDTNIVRRGENIIVIHQELYDDQIHTLSEEQVNLLQKSIDSSEKTGEEVNLNHLPAPVLKTIKPLIFKNSVKVQSAEVVTLIFASVEHAKEAIKKSREAGYKKRTSADKINAKYDAQIAQLEAELKALEQSSTITSSIEAKKAEIIQTNNPTIQTIGNVTFGTANKQGQTDNNEDAVYIDMQNGIFILADGMGGEGMITLSPAQASKEVVSRLLGKQEKTLTDLIYEEYLKNPNISSDDVVKFLISKGFQKPNSIFITPMLNAFKTKADLSSKKGFRSGATALKAVKTGNNTYAIEKVGDTVFFVVDKNGKVIQQHGLSDVATTQGYMFSVKDGKPFSSTPKTDNFTITLNEGETLVLATDFIETDKAIQDFINSDFGKKLDFAKFQKENKSDDSTFITIKYDAELKALEEQLKTTEENFEKIDVILPIGTSGSGKSTFIKSLPQKNLVIIEPDTMRVEFTGDINNKSKDKEIYEEAAKRAVKAIKQGKQVVFDTTNLTKDKRLPFIEAIKKEIPNANIQYKLMKLNPELAKQRIKAQIARGENRANVPESTIDRHAESYKQMLEDIKSEPITEFKINIIENLNPIETLATDMMNRLGVQFEVVDELNINENVQLAKEDSSNTLKTDKTILSLQEAFELGIYDNLFAENNIKNVNDLKELNNNQLGELLKKICK